MQPFFHTTQYFLRFCLSRVSHKHFTYGHIKSLLKCFLAFRFMTNVHGRRESIDKFDCLSSQMSYSCQSTGTSKAIWPTHFERLFSKRDPWKSCPPVVTVCGFFLRPPTTVFVFFTTDNFSRLVKFQWCLFCFLFRISCKIPLMLLIFVFHKHTTLVVCCFEAAVALGDIRNYCDVIWFSFEWD